MSKNSMVVNISSHMQKNLDQKFEYVHFKELKMINVKSDVNSKSNENNSISKNENDIKKETILELSPLQKNSKEEENEKKNENDGVVVKKEKNASYLCKEISQWTLKYLCSLVLGFLFGYAMEKAKVYEPKAIRQQMIFRRFIMLKMFLSAFASSTISILIFALIFKKR
jgi:hypothetical protein